MRRLLPPAVLVAVTLAGAPRVASARVLEHVVEKGDTVAILAAEYYGDRELAIYILAANHWSVPPRKLAVGSTIAIPISYRYIVQPGDTLSSLARRELGDARRASYLGVLNDLPPGRQPEVGSQLLIPYDLVHVAAAPETLADVAAIYYGDSAKAALLGEYNFRVDRPLVRGERIDVPITDLEVRPTKHGPASQTEVAQAAEDDLQASRQHVAAGLDEARRAYAAGDYAAVADELFSLIGEGPTDEQLSDIHELLAFDYVALGVPELAVRHFCEVLARHPGLTLDPATTSPKIRAALDEARRRLHKSDN